jgi:7-carboxy-7-deazaguanine synthase
LQSQSRWNEARKPPDVVYDVIEVFGPTIQGEGPQGGSLAHFIRLADCNLACSWCDTRYSWDWKAHNRREVVETLSSLEIIERLRRLAPIHHIIVTGGEPLFRPAISVLLKELTDVGTMIEVETNGTILPPEELKGHQNIFFNVSPKLSNSHQGRASWIDVDLLSRLSTWSNTCLKFVVRDRADLDEVAEYARDGWSGRVWIQCEGTTAEEILDRQRELILPILERGWNLSTRLHTLIWGNARGR